MTTVQQLEYVAPSQKHNGHPLLAENFVASLPGQRRDLAPRIWAGAAVRPAIAQAVLADENSARAENIRKYSKRWLEPNAFAQSARTQEDLGKLNTTIDDRPVVYVVDDDTSVRGCLEALMRRAGWRCELFATAREFLSKSKIVKRSCLLLEFDLPDLTGLDLQRTLADHMSEMPIVFLTHQANVPIAVEAMKRGAIDFLTKPCDDDVLLAALQKAIERGQERFDGARITQTIRDRRVTLSRREHEVMSLVVTGLLNKQIGFELGISEITVKAHRGQVMRKMGAKSLASLVTMAGKIGLAAAPPP